MSGKDVCLVFGTAAVCWMFGYYWTKRQTGLTTTPASFSQSDSPSRTSAQLIPENSEEDARLDKERLIQTNEDDTEIKVPPPDSYLITTPASLSPPGSPSRTSAQLIPRNSEEYIRLNGNDLEEDRDHVGGQWYDAVILHASEDEMAARLCQEILQEQVNVPNLKISLPDDIITPGTPTLDGLAILLLKCRLVIIYHSRHMSMDGLMLFGKQANIIQSLDDPQKRNRIIPFIVDGEEMSVDMCTIQPVNYTNDIRSANFPNFKNKMERLFLMWRDKIA
ncbi:Hypothetical predicted protein [Mytilus galloprovincialis]|uniref:TIR domain-containing protein n=1 Tax=Mytilus galloprovincialis TaxID=29158 RepID=A0A8B6HAR1_MYTGA|nr:Hypothetical predicted protein [Mytilus galloprovincialis]